MSCFEWIFKELDRKKNKIMDGYSRNENLKKSISCSKALICFITKEFKKDKQRIEHCDIASNENKIMYAAVKKGVRLGKFKKYPWRKIEYFETEEDLKKIMDIFTVDYRWIQNSGGA